MVLPHMSIVGRCMYMFQDQVYVNLQAYVVFVVHLAVHRIYRQIIFLFNLVFDAVARRARGRVHAGQLWLVGWCSCVDLSLSIRRS